MSAAFTDGLPGLEATLEWTSGHRLGTQVTLNDTDPTQDWRVVLTDIPGLHGKSDAEDLRRKKLGRVGEIPGPVTASGRTISPVGRIEAKTKPDLRKAEMALNAAFEEENLEGTMRIRRTWDADPLATPPADDPYWFFTGRCLGFDPDDQQQVGDDAAWPYQRGCTIGFRCSDPVRYWSIPIAGGPNLSTVTVVNPGIAVNPLIYVETAGSADFTIFNDTLGKQITFRASELAAAKQVTFDFQRRIIWANDIGDTPFVDGGPVTNLRTSSVSTWWDPLTPAIDRGSNALRQTGATNIAVSFFPGI